MINIIKEHLKEYFYEYLSVIACLLIVAGNYVLMAYTGRAIHKATGEWVHAMVVSAVSREVDKEMYVNLKSGMNETNTHKSCHEVDHD